MKCNILTYDIDILTHIKYNSEPLYNNVKLCIFIDSGFNISHFSYIVLKYLSLQHILSMHAWYTYMYGHRINRCFVFRLESFRSY